MRNNKRNIQKNVTIRPKTLVKKVTAPASKSMMQRAVALGILSEGKTTIFNPSFASDSLSALRIAGSLGATLQFTFNKIALERNDEVTESKLNFGESGLGLRMLTPVAALFNKEFTIDGHGSLVTRPTGTLVEALLQGGVRANDSNGILPLRIEGKLQGGDFNIDGSLGSQVLTGLLTALPVTEKDSIIQVKQLKSTPYIDLTLDMVKQFGVKIENQNYERFLIPGKQSYRAQEIMVEGDWSGSAFLLVAGLITGKMTVFGLNLNSRQADMAILEAIKKAGGKIDIKENEISTEKSDLQAFEFDATHCPDLFPPLVTLAAYCKGTTVIKGAKRLTHKESNRSKALETEFAKLGIQMRSEDDVMYIEGGEVQAAITNSHNDHRIAMAVATAALGGSGEVYIENSDCVNKSYPNFYMDIR